LTLARWGGVAGLAYVAAVVVGNVVADPPSEAGTSNARLDFYNDSGNQWRVFAGALVIGVAALAFVGFLFALCDVVDELGVFLVLSQLLFLGIPILVWIAATAAWLVWTGRGHPAEPLA
jgi:hypothetical protein